jgi:hypothetical protein
VIEPRNYCSRGSRRRRKGGRQHRSAVVAERRGPAGVEEQGTFIVGPPGTWEVLSPPPMNPVWGSPVNNPWPIAVASCGYGNEVQGARRYRESEGNEATREGRQEVGVLYSTDEAGEPTRGCAKKMRKHRAVPEMKVDPSEPSCRGRLQTAISCFGQKPRW